jgi:hypothetical protein
MKKHVRRQILKTILITTALGAAVTVNAQDEKAGRLELQHHLDYSVPFGDATFVGTHNSFNSSAYISSNNEAIYTWPNHAQSMDTQLNYGARVLSLDVHHAYNNIVLCHNFLSGVCGPTDLDFAEGLKEIRSWLRLHPNEVVLIDIEDKLTADAHYTEAVTDIRNILGDLGDDIAYQPNDYAGSNGGCNEIPHQSLTKQAILTAGKQVIISTGGGCNKDSHTWRDWVWNTPMDPFPKPKDSSSVDNRIRRFPHTWAVTYEDRVFNSVGAITSSWLTQAMAKGVAFVGFDKFISDDRRESAIWSWKANEPNDAGSGEHCAVSTTGGFNDDDCTNKYRYACQNKHDGSWKLSKTEDTDEWLLGDLSCAALGSDYVFAVPVNATLNAALRTVAGSATVWINYNDKTSEGQWVVGNAVSKMRPLVGAGCPVDATSCIELPPGANLFDYIKIPLNTPYDEIEITVRGAPAGLARFIEITNPSEGEWGDWYSQPKSPDALVATYAIGDGPDEIPPGSSLGFIYGMESESVVLIGPLMAAGCVLAGDDCDLSDLPPVGLAAGTGGGGGSAVLIFAPDSATTCSNRLFTANSCWSPLLVAAGGGGTFASTAGSTSGGHVLSFATPSEAGGGDASDAAGGGGFWGDGGNNCIDLGIVKVISNGHAGKRIGGLGGDKCGFGSGGGFGFGGGGAAGTANGGGGGGYKGGRGGNLSTDIAIATGSAGKSFVNDAVPYKNVSIDPDFPGPIAYRLSITNNPPVADAGPDQTVECTGATTSVQLDGSGSYDDDDDPLTYLWTGSSTDMSPLLALALGVHDFDLTVDDGMANDTDSVQITVQDTTAPTTDAGGNQTLEATSSAGAAYTVLYSVTDDCDPSPSYTVLPLPSPFPMGTTTVVVDANDASGNVATDSADITVEDTTSPVVTVPSDITVTATMPAGAVVDWIASALDIVDGSITPTCTPASGSTFAHGTVAVNCVATDAADNTGSAGFSVIVLNAQPTADAQSVTFDEDTTKAITLSGNDVDDYPITPLAFGIVTGPVNGSLSGVIPNLTYTPDLHFFGSDSFTFRTFDGDLYSSTVTVDITVDPVNDMPIISIDRGTASLQYSDEIGTVTITATDVDDNPLKLSSSWTLNGGAANFGLPSALGTSGSCTTTDTDYSPVSGTSCSWTLSGQMREDAGDYDITFTVTDGGGGTTTKESDSGATEIIVNGEDASISFDLTNTVAVQVDGDGSDSSLPFSLTVYIDETEADIATFVAMYGDLSLAVPHMQLTPVGPGGPEGPDSCDTSVAGTGYDQVMTYTCHFSGVPVNTYSVDVKVDGGYYIGENDDVFTVFDPSLGFTTGGGWFYWPGTNDKTNFGYTMKYNKKRTNLQGSLLLIRHVEGSVTGEKYRVKSNALHGLAIGSDPDFGWAVFDGKATYRAPGVENEGNNEFTVYVEDHGVPGKGVDQFWIQTRDQQDDVRIDLSMPEPGAGNTETIEGGNIFVPHTSRGRGK